MSGEFVETKPSANPLNVSNWKRVGSFYLSSLSVGILISIIMVLILIVVPEGPIAIVLMFVVALFGSILLLTTYDYFMDNHTRNPVKRY